jgi:hypothetical protein
MIEISSSACCHNLQIIVEYTLLIVDYVYLGVCLLQMVFLLRWRKECSSAKMIKMKELSNPCISTAGAA